MLLFLLSFVAGFVSTMTFHQGLLGIFYLVGLAKDAPYSLSPTKPFGVPESVSMALWGGIWGVALWLGLQLVGPGWPYWTLAVVGGSIGPTLVTLLVVFPLKGRPDAVGGLPVIAAGAAVVNAAWGFGVGLFMYLIQRWILPN